MAAFGGPVRAQNTGAELFRLRIVNRTTGAIQVSSDRGRLWETIGEVRRPASTVAIGPAVAAIVPAGTVAGVSSTTVLLRLPSKSATVKTLRLLAAGQQASNATILTDLPPGSALFRFLAPTARSPILLERDGKVGPLPTNYAPRLDDGIIISVREPPQDAYAVTIENRKGGNVILEGEAGDRQVIGKVRQPLRGIGRYADCRQSGRGAVVAHRPSTITVSTVSRLRFFDENDQPVESRGGFVIQPSEPALRGTTHPASQILIEGVGDEDERGPISDLFGLPTPVSGLLPVDRAATKVEVKIDGGDWEPMPNLRGTINEDQLLAALAKALDRPVQRGITHLRLVPGRPDLKLTRHAVRLATTPPSVAGPQRGNVNITADVKGEGITLVIFYLNGRQVLITNQKPYTWRFPTTKFPNGEHLIEIRGQDENGAVVNTVFTRLLVDN